MKCIVPILQSEPIQPKNLPQHIRIPTRRTIHHQSLPSKLGHISDAGHRRNRQIRTTIQFAEDSDGLVLVEVQGNGIVDRAGQNVVSAVEQLRIAVRRIGDLKVSDIQAIGSEEAELIGDRVCCCLSEGAIIERRQRGGKAEVSKRGEGEDRAERSHLSGQDIVKT